MTQLIQCGDHRWVPWCIVCVHLCGGTRTAVVVRGLPAESTDSTSVMLPAL
jgi:hypothetical protein